jgi:hypothetical protein
MWRKKWLALVASGLLLSGCSSMGGPFAGSEPPPPVSVDQAQEQAAAEEEGWGYNYDEFAGSQGMVVVLAVGAAVAAGLFIWGNMSWFD